VNDPNAGGIEQVVINTHDDIQRPGSFTGAGHERHASRLDPGKAVKGHPFFFIFAARFVNYVASLTSRSRRFLVCWLVRMRCWSNDNMGRRRLGHACCQRPVDRVRIQQMR